MQNAEFRKAINGIEIVRRHSPFCFLKTAFCIYFALNLATSLAQPPPADDPPGRWKLETVTLKSGMHYRGLVQTQRETELDFAEIVQPPGRPMYAVVRGIAMRDVDKVERLKDEEYAELALRFGRFRNRAVIEAGRIDQVVLEIAFRSEQATLLHQGPWFTLASSTDDERTRQCVVRIEQIFRAYRTLLPPRVAKPERLSVVLCGSLDEYRGRLRTLDLSLDNAAFYSPRERTIWAGSDLNLFAERLGKVRRDHDEVKRTYGKLDTEHAARLATLSTELKAGGFSEDEAAAEIRQRRASWKEQMDEVLSANVQRQRANEQKFADVTRQMFSRLNHEAFHAYLDMFVYPHDQHHVPRWLNEGLAQVFETGQLDGDSLRIDAPDRDRLTRLQQDLSTQPLPLAQLLTAQEREFLGPHGDSSSQRHYLYAWGLAYHLAFQENLLGTARLDRYVSPAAQKLGPVARFEGLVNQPLPKFEQRWREAMTAAR
jgi:hypothetical protein